MKRKETYLSRDFRETAAHTGALPPCSRCFCQIHPERFWPGGGLCPKRAQTGNGVWRVDMMECPYHDTCTEYGCPELCRCFCDSEQLLLSAGQGENASVRQCFNSQIGYGFRYSFVHEIPVCADVLQPEGNLGRRVGVEKLRFRVLENRTDRFGDFVHGESEIFMSSTVTVPSTLTPLTK